MENTNEKRLYQVAEIQLTFKSHVKPSLRPKIAGSRDAYNVLFENWDGWRIVQYDALLDVKAVINPYLLYNSALYYTY